MTTIYLVRHGKTQWNMEKRFQGSGDSPLTEEGIAEISRLAKKMEDKPLKAVYSSTRQRAFLTANQIAKPHHLKVNFKEGLGEINLGSWEGKTHEEIQREDPVGYHHFLYKPHCFKPERGNESLEKVQERSVQALGDIVKEHQNSCVLVVTHAITLRLLLLYYEKRPLEDLWDVAKVRQTSVTELAYLENGVEILRKADISHLNIE
ncbi:histidine phosphatase family protein [Tindallia californiensis]|uniref:Probable phosphoglycerate mutase n=1 Tax=Tindallia californiensis TaxID=159292 RepID=A0A1H3K8R5_9FIRM|nr:histidine phosphatase family protein [Tindallia californiensis]SDY47978.1 probable phosphoglycerate mutase [Tindallia californiensis]